MAVVSTGLIIAGIIITAVGSAAAAGGIVHYSKKEKEQRKKDLDTTIAICKEHVVKFKTIKDELYAAQNDLTDAKSDFLAGGHVYNNKAPATQEFNHCSNRINHSITRVNTLIAYLESDVEKMTNERNSL